MKCYRKQDSAYTCVYRKLCVCVVFGYNLILYSTLKSATKHDVYLCTKDKYCGYDTWYNSGHRTQQLIDKDLE